MNAFQEITIRNLNNGELLRYADRSNPEVKELAERLETALMHVESLQLETARLRNHLNHYTKV